MIKFLIGIGLMGLGLSFLCNAVHLLSPNNIHPDWTAFYLILTCALVRGGLATLNED